MYDPKHPDLDKIAEARTINLKNNISLGNQRNEEQAEAIEQGLSSCIAFVASEAIHHPRCYQKLHKYVFVVALVYFFDIQ